MGSMNTPISDPEYSFKVVVFEVTSLLDPYPERNVF